MKAGDEDLDAVDRILRLRAWMLAVVLAPVGVASAATGQRGLAAALVLPSVFVLAALWVTRRRERLSRR